MNNDVWHKNIKFIRDKFENLQFIQEVQEKDLMRKNKYIKELQDDYFAELKDPRDGVFVKRNITTTPNFDYSLLEMWDVTPLKIKRFWEENPADLVLMLFHAGHLKEIGNFEDFNIIVKDVDNYPRSSVVTGLSLYVKREFKSALEKFIIGEDALSLYFVGRCFQRGEGFHMDETEAFKWYLKAADKGNAMAQCQVGMYLKDGIKNREARDIKEAVKWFQKSEWKENSVVQYHLATCYMNGHGVGQNVEMAKELYRLSYIQGDIEAKKQYEFLDHHSHSE